MKVIYMDHILSGPSKKHGRVKIDPFFLIWFYGKVTTRLKVIQTKPRQKYALKYKHDLSY